MKCLIFILLISLIKTSSSSSSEDIIYINSSNTNYIYHKNGNFSLLIDEYYDHNPVNFFYWVAGKKVLILNLANLQTIEMFNDTEGVEFKHFLNNLQIKTNEKKISYHVVYSIICRFLYATKYIKNLIYSVTINNNYMPYLLSFGGVNKKAISNLDLNKKITFGKNDILSEIYINGKNISFEGKYNVIFSENISSICLPDELFTIFNDTFLNKYHEYEEYYISKSLSLPEINFIFMNKNILLNKNNYLFDHRLRIAKQGNYDESDFFRIFIKNKPCKNLIFGFKFLYLFDLIEFNLEKGETSFYINNIKGNDLLFEANEKKVFYNSTSYVEFIMIISFILFSIFLIYTKRFQKKINEIEEYLDIYSEI